MAEALQAEDFRPHLGEAFRVRGAAHTLVLEAVEVHAGATPDHFRRPFVVIFTDPKPGGVLPEGLYACEAADGDRFEIYLAPIHTPGPDRQDYQAVFN